LLIKTNILLGNQDNPDEGVISDAAKVIRGGGIVSFPTETVYALGADAYNEEMVAKIYRIKRRDRSRAISVFLKGAEHTQSIVDCVSPDAEKLMDKFWPGPLTLVFKCTSSKLCLVLAKGDKLGVRVSPSNLIARILDETGVPITATSANISGKKSCVVADRVFYFFNGRVEMIIDGGKSNVFLPSTVLDVSGEETSLIRLGHIPVDQIQKVVPKLRIPEEENPKEDCKEEVKVGAISEEPQNEADQTQTSTVG
jgi:L-threonylcarbamoyladenylate synthase